MSPGIPFVRSDGPARGGHGVEGPGRRSRVCAIPAALLLALLLSLTPSLPRAAPLELRGKDAAVAMQAVTALVDEDVARARALLAPMEPFDQAPPPVRFAGGVLRFYEQRYAEAVGLLEASGAGGSGPFLPLARAAQEVTRGHVRTENDHFTVSCPRGKDEVLVHYLLDALERQRAALAEALGTVPAGRLTVELLSDVKELARLSTLTEEEVRTSGTVAVAKFGKLMVLSPKALLKGYDWLDTAAHEYTHGVVTERTRNRAPLWLQEGLAKWFEQAWRGRREPVTPYTAALVREAVARKDLVTFEEMHPSLAKLPTQEPPALARLTGLLGEGRTVEEAMAQVAGVPLKRFLQDWTRYLAVRPLPRGGDHELQKLRFKDDPKQGTSFAEWSEIPDEDSRGHARLGEIFRARGRWSAARLEYGAAYQKVGARFAILSGQYALAASMSGAKAEAEKVLAEALAWNPDYPALNVQLARLLFERGQHAAARDRLLDANRVDPFDPEIHAGLSKAYAALGDQAGAARESRITQVLTGQEVQPR